MKIFSDNYWEKNGSWAALRIMFVNGFCIVQLVAPTGHMRMFEDMFGTLHTVNNVVNYYLEHRPGPDHEKMEWAFNAYVHLLNIAFALDDIDRENLTFKVRGWVPENAHLILRSN